MFKAYRLLDGGVWGPLGSPIDRIWQLYDPADKEWKRPGHVKLKASRSDTVVLEMPRAQFELNFPKSPTPRG